MPLWASFQLVPIWSIIVLTQPFELYKNFLFHISLKIQEKAAKLDEIAEELKTKIDTLESQWNTLHLKCMKRSVNNSKKDQTSKKYDSFKKKKLQARYSKYEL